MKNFFYNLWNKFKTQPDIWFFFIFLLTFSISIRKVLFYFPIQGTFNEYSGIYVYISDIALILTLVLWLIYTLNNNNIQLSSIRLWIKRVFSDKFLLLPLFLVFLFFLSILWSENKSIAIFRSIKILEFYLLYIYIIFRITPKLFHACPNQNCFTLARSENVPHGTSYSSSPCKGEELKEGLKKIVPRGTFHLFSLIIIFLGLFQGIIGIIQFIIQKSVGLFWLRESLISPEILGVAKIILNKEVYIRAYGLMPHPNILGGFLLFSIIFTLLYKKLLHACPPENCSTWNIFGRMEQFWEDGTFSDGWNILGRVEQFKIIGVIWFFKLILLIQIIALILTFSKSAMIGLIIALIYIYTPFSLRRRKIGDEVELFHACPPENCSTWNNFGRVEQFWEGGTFSDGWNNFWKVEHSKALLLSGLIILTFFFLIAKPDPSSLFINSLKERLIGYKTVLNIEMFHACPVEKNCSTWNNFVYFRGGTFIQDPILGAGSGQSVLIMQNFYSQTLNFWEYQPVHNIFLIILSELGLVGLILFIWWLLGLFYVIVPRGTINNSQDGVKENINLILNNNKIHLSSIIFHRYSKGILLGFIFIMLFDHYLWDIQQGSLLFWLIAGFIGGIYINTSKKY